VGEPTVSAPTPAGAPNDWKRIGINVGLLLMTEDNDQPNLRPMSEFDLSKRAMVHDRLNDETFEWMPERHMPHREPVWEAEPGVIAWDGLLLDGRRPIG
jgi:hypothetical protein